jgi:cell division protein ZapA
MQRRSVQVEIGGQSYSLHSSAEAGEVERLASLVNAKLGEHGGPGRGPQALLLASISLAHDLERERESRAHYERRTRDLVRRVLVRVEEALDDLPAEVEGADSAS